MLSTKLKEAAGNSADATLYVNDVFSTWLYTGNGSTQTINNGIDLAGKGGLVWIKSRSAAAYNCLFDTARGANNVLWSNTTNAQVTYPSPFALTAFNSNGFNLNAEPDVNQNTTTYASWTFRKAAKFFDVVTYTGSGSARTIAHSLGIAPGMVIVKRTDTTGNWQVYSNGLTSAAYSIQLNLTAAQASAPTVWNSTAPTSSVFSVGTDATVNASGGTYVAYLFAHDTSSTGIIQCGGFTTDASGVASISLGWEPQYLLYKNIDSAVRDWNIVDTMRGFTVSSAEIALYANSSQAESSYGNNKPTATGITFDGNASSKYIYMAIRRPNKPPTTGTQVFMPISTPPGTTVTAGFVPDMSITKQTNNGVGGGSSTYTGTRLQGNSVYLAMNTTAAEAAFGWQWDNTTTKFTQTSSGTPTYSDIFARAPGFFDVVCYTGTGVATTQAHNLGVVPELMIVKSRSNATNWTVYVNALGNMSYLLLQGVNAAATGVHTWNDTTPTSSVFSLGTQLSVNGSGYTFVAYLFATLAGIQYINSYVGDGTTGRVINCGFSAGARFICIKATSTTGSWWVWDSARGITSTNDPALQLNSTAAEITLADAIDPSSSGFIVNQEATCSINASGVSYLVWAIA